MKLNRILAVMGALASVAMTTAGCGGVSGSHSVSPASFFLPGLIYHSPRVPAEPEATPPGAEAPATEALPAQLPS